jgi:hypothetical protein
MHLEVDAVDGANLVVTTAEGADEAACQDRGSHGVGDQTPAIARQTFSGVHGISIWRTPRWERASTTAE